MRILVFAITWNCSDVIRYFLRHYETFADEISVFDAFSSDGTRQILAAHPKVILRDWHNDTGIDEDRFLEHWRDWIPKAHGGGFDWVLIPDPDEMIYGPDVRATLTGAMTDGIDVVHTDGYNMMGDGLPKDDGRQIWQINPMGVRAPVYSKPVVFNPKIEIDWNRGKHALAKCSGVQSPRPLLKLLHYRYMGYAYTAAKNAKNYARCGLQSGDKGAAWSCSPGYNGVNKEHSPMWAEAARKLAFNVLEV